MRRALRPFGRGVLPQIPRAVSCAEAVFRIQAKIPPRREQLRTAYLLSSLPRDLATPAAGEAPNGIASAKGMSVRVGNFICRDLYKRITSHEEITAVSDILFYFDTIFRPRGHPMGCPPTGPRSRRD